MAGSCKVEDVGKVGICKLCSREFIIGRPCDGQTFIYCLSCSKVTMSKNYQLLTEEEKKLRLAYLASYRRGPSRGKYLATCLRGTAKWRKNNPNKKYIQKERGKDRYNEETLMLADNHCSRWGSDEIEYLKEKSEVKTAREIAFDLGRTYNAIMGKAGLVGIPLMTEDKKHMRLVTK